MSATLTKAKDAVTRRSRLEIIDAAIEGDEGKLAATTARMADLAVVEDEAVVEAKRKDPSASPYALGSPAQTARAEREKLERSLDGLAKGLAALREERVEAAREDAACRLAGHIEEGRDLLAKERDVRLAAGKVIAQLAETWERLVPVLEARSSLRARVASERLLENVGGDTEAARRWAEVADYAIEPPLAVTFGSFVAQLVEAALADRVDAEAEVRAVDELNARRRALAARNPGGREDLPLLVAPVVRTDPLHELTPHLGDVVRSAEVSGVAIRRAHAAEPVLPDRAA